MRSLSCGQKVCPLEAYAYLSQSLSDRRPDDAGYLGFT